MQRTILAVNAGSSSVKRALFTFEPHPRLLARDSTEGNGRSDASELLGFATRLAPDAQLVAVGHRIVHGGPNHFSPQRIDADFVHELEAIIPFAPNHLPSAIALIARSAPRSSWLRSFLPGRRTTPGGHKRAARSP